MEALFTTIHGSRLYGLAHADSDSDYFTVVNKVKTSRKKYAAQTIVDGVDTTVMDLGTWLHYCEMGAPQSLEAMFSRRPVVDHIGALRAQYRAGTQVYSRYLHVIKTCAMEDDFKHKRHALRLALNLRSIGRTGRFNPTLSPAAVQVLNRWARADADVVYEIALRVAWS